jgi:hypothetical protein
VLESTIQTKIQALKSVFFKYKTPFGLGFVSQLKGITSIVKYQEKIKSEMVFWKFNHSSVKPIFVLFSASSSTFMVMKIKIPPTNIQIITRETINSVNVIAFLLKNFTIEKN